MCFQPFKHISLAFPQCLNIVLISHFDFSFVALTVDLLCIPCFHSVCTFSIYNPFSIFYCNLILTSVNSVFTFLWLHMLLELRCITYIFLIIFLSFLGLITVFLFLLLLSFLCTYQSDSLVEIFCFLHPISSWFCDIVFVKSFCGSLRKDTWEVIYWKCLFFSHTWLIVWMSIEL